MEYNTTVTLLRTSTLEEYQLSIPIIDIDEFFIAMDWYDEFLNNQYLIIELKGAFDFLLYDQFIDISVLNRLLLRFKQLDEAAQETVIYLTHLNSDTVDALQYSLRNYDKFVLVPAHCSSPEAISKFVITTCYLNSLLKYFSDAICYEDFYQYLFKHCIAFYIDERILIKKIELED